MQVKEENISLLDLAHGKKPWIMSLPIAIRASGATEKNLRCRPISIMLSILHGVLLVIIYTYQENHFLRRRRPRLRQHTKQHWNINLGISANIQMITIQIRKTDAKVTGNPATLSTCGSQIKGLRNNTTRAKTNAMAACPGKRSESAVIADPSISTLTSDILFVMQFVVQ